ncbi:protein kinase [bacterium]|nr:protein kinase [bacterium]
MNKEEIFKLSDRKFQRFEEQNNKDLEKILLRLKSVHAKRGMLNSSVYYISYQDALFESFSRLLAKKLEFDMIDIKYQLLMNIPITKQIEIDRIRNLSSHYLRQYISRYKHILYESDAAEAVSRGESNFRRKLEEFIIGVTSDIEIAFMELERENSTQGIIQHEDMEESKVISHKLNKKQEGKEEVIQIEVLTAIWMKYLETYEWPKGKSFRKALGREIVKATISKLSPIYAYHHNDHNEDFYTISFLGVYKIQGIDSPLFRNLIRFFEYLQIKFNKDPEFSTISSEEIEKELKLSEEEVRTLGFLLHLDYGFPGGGGISKDMSKWTKGVPEFIEELYYTDDASSFLKQYISNQIVAKEAMIGEKKKTFPIELVGNKWQIREQIGKGGQGKVCKVIKIGEKKEYAMKIVKLNRDEKKKRFITELKTHKTLSDLGAENIIPIIDYNLEKIQESQEGYYVMPLAVNTLEDIQSITMDRFEISLEIFLKIVNGIVNAHAEGIIHRDIKPKNILFLARNPLEPFVSDFGICFLKEQQSGSRVTGTREKVGPYNFIAPEQEEGINVDVKETVDIYSLGKLLYYMLTGKNIYRENLDNLFSTEELDSDPRLSLLIEHVFQGTIKTMPSERIQSSKELSDVIENILSKIVGKNSGGLGFNKSTVIDDTNDERVLWLLPRGYLILSKIAFKKFNDWSTECSYSDYRNTFVYSTHYHSSYHDFWIKDPESQFKKLGILENDWYPWALGAINLLIKLREADAQILIDKEIEMINETFPHVYYYPPNEKIYLPYIPEEFKKINSDGHIRDLIIKLQNYILKTKSERIEQDVDLINSSINDYKQRIYLSTSAYIGDYKPGQKMLDEIVSSFEVLDSYGMKFNKIELWCDNFTNTVLNILDSLL